MPTWGTTQHGTFGKFWGTFQKTCWWTCSWNCMNIVYHLGIWTWRVSQKTCANNINNCNIYFQLQVVIPIFLSNFLTRTFPEEFPSGLEQEMQVCSTINGTSKVHARAKDVRLSPAVLLKVALVPTWKNTHLFEVEATVWKKTWAWYRVRPSQPYL